MIVNCQSLKIRKKSTKWDKIIENKKNAQIIPEVQKNVHDPWFPGLEEEEERGRLLLLNFVVLKRRICEAFINRSTVKNRIRYSIKKLSVIREV